VRFYDKINDFKKNSVFKQILRGIIKTEKTETTKTETSKKRPAHRPKRRFTPEEIAKIDHLASIGADNITIAHCVDSDENSIKRYFWRQIKQKRAEFKAQILGYQQKMAANQPVMAIWCGKQHLGQKDNQVVTIKSLPAIKIELSGAPENG
jgi:hypothetical protein